MVFKKELKETLFLLGTDDYLEQYASGHPKKGLFRVVSILILREYMLKQKILF